MIWIKTEFCTVYIQFNQWHKNLSGDKQEQMILGIPDAKIPFLSFQQTAILLRCIYLYKKMLYTVNACH